MLSNEVPHQMLLAAPASAIRGGLADRTRLPRAEVSVLNGTIVLKDVGRGLTAARGTHQLVRTLAHGLPFRALVLITAPRIHRSDAGDEQVGADDNNKLVFRC